MKKISKFEIANLKATNVIDSEFCEIKEVDWHNVLFFRAEGSYTRLFFENRKEVKYSKRIALVCLYLNQADFFRCHRKFVVNISKIKTVEFSNHPNICLVNDVVIPVSSRKRSLFKKYIGKYVLSN